MGYEIASHTKEAKVGSRAQDKITPISPQLFTNPTKSSFYNGVYLNLNHL